MTAKTITARTEIGTFTRRTANAYTHIIVETGSGNALRWSGNVNATPAKNAKVAADGVRYFKSLLGAENYMDIKAFPILAEPTTADSMVPAPALAEIKLAESIGLVEKAPESPEARVSRLNSRRAAQARAAAPETAPVASQDEQLRDAHEQGSILTRAEARAFVGTDTILRQVGKSLTHAIKADRKDDTLARTLCGVPINGAAQNWLSMGLGLPNCHTCRQAAQKAA